MQIKSFNTVNLFFFILFCTIKTFSYEPKEGNINATLGPYIFKTNSAGPIRSPLLAGEELIANGDVNPHGALEVDLFHINKNFYLTHGASSLAESRETLVVGMGYRYWIRPYVSAAMTFYSSYGMGDVHTIHSDFPVGDPTQTSAWATTLYGFDFALQAEVWTQGRYAVVIDGRYSLSVTHKSGEQADDYGGMIGLRYFIQEKQVVDKPKDQI